MFPLQESLSGFIKHYLLVTECLLLTGLDEQLLWPDTDMRDVMLSDDGSFNVRV